jgi:hypothetical protein
MKNKYGLSRYIPEGIKQRIRSDAGCGCIFCGSAIVEYEHIEPSFSEAKSHDPECMTLLCPACHTKVTMKVISKKKVWAQKRTPKAKQDGFVRDAFFSAANEKTFFLGGVKISVGSAMSLAGKPILWFEEAVNGGPLMLCAIFHDANGELMAYINRNEFIGFSKKLDVQSISSRLLIKKDNSTFLEVDRAGDEPLKILNIDSLFLNVRVEIESDGSVVASSAGKQFTKLGPNSAINTGKGLYIGSVPWGVIGSLVSSVVHAVSNGEILRDFSGRQVGWIIRRNGIDILLNQHGAHLGFSIFGEVFLLTGHYVGHLSGDQIGFQAESYSWGEPIYVDSLDRATRNIRVSCMNDLSYRLFGDYDVARLDWVFRQSLTKPAFGRA